jgi:CrcB protein
VIPFYVALGGAIGSLARYGMGSWIQVRAGAEFPWGTFAVNGLGSLLIGIVLGYLTAVDAFPGPRLFLVVGVLGGFTTFSTFSYEVVTLLQSGGWGRAALYAAGTMALGVVAVFIGMQIAEIALKGR